jgi:hypothetical protein
MFFERSEARMKLFRTEVRVVAPAISFGCFVLGMVVVIFTRTHWLHVLGAILAALEFSFQPHGSVDAVVDLSDEFDEGRISL